METEYAGAPVDGGTYPALIWSDVISAYEGLMDERGASKDDDSGDDTETVAPVAPPVEAAPVEPAPVAPAPAPEAPVPEAPVPAEPAPAAPAPPPGAGAPTAGGVAE